MADTSFDEDECRAIAAVKIQAIARGKQTRTILQSNDIQAAKITLAERYEERSASLASVRRRSSGNHMNDSKVLAVLFLEATHFTISKCSSMSIAAVFQNARQYEQERKIEEERACVQMQALYR
jgi:hypothetical protein